jgi:hypothetical protein
MKRNFFALMLICLTTWSCKKESSKGAPNTGGKSSHKVMLTIGFSKQTVDFQANGLKVNSINRPLTSQALADQVEVVIFGVYNANGSRLKIIKQLSTDEGFGTFSDELPDGNYTVVAAAGKMGLSLTNDIVWSQERGIASYFDDDSKLGSDILTYGGLGPDSSWPTPIGFNEETFWQKVSLTIPGNVAQTIYLDRVTTEVKVVVKDAIPANAKFFGITINNVADKCYVYNGLGVNMTGTLASVENYFSIPSSAIGTLNYTFSQPFLALPKATVTIYCGTQLFGQEANDDIAKAIVPNVACFPNQRTVLTGILFGGAGIPATNGFHIIADTSWNGTPPITKPF